MSAPATKPSRSPYVSIHRHSSQILCWRVRETKRKKGLKVWKTNHDRIVRRFLSEVKVLYLSDKEDFLRHLSFLFVSVSRI